MGSTNRIIQLQVMGENQTLLFKSMMCFFRPLIFCVLSDPPVLENSEYLNLTEKVGNNALLPCHAHGIPQPEIQWLQSDSSPIALTERM